MYKNPEDKKRYYIEHKEKILKQQREYILKHSKEIKLYKDKWQKDNKERLCKVRQTPEYKKHKKEYRIKNKERINEYNIIKKYGISLKQFNDLFFKQQGVCGICKIKLPNGFDRNKCVDHNHKNNKVRGILCRKCNVGISLFDDKVDILLQAINYLNQK